MPKLIFKYGTMNSSKTANLLMSAHNYRNKNKKIILIKPKIDNRFGENIIKSRTGLQANCDIVLDKNDSFYLYSNIMDNADYIFIDEAQFLSIPQINELRELSNKFNIICYGLKTDYMTNLFEGSKRLIELADNIQEIPSLCIHCNKKAIINAKFINEEIVYVGSSEPDIGAEEKYKAMCWKCWFNNN